MFFALAFSRLRLAASYVWRHLEYFNNIRCCRLSSKTIYTHIYVEAKYSLQQLRQAAALADKLPASALFNCFSKDFYPLHGKTSHHSALRTPPRAGLSQTAPGVECSNCSCTEPALTPPPFHVYMISSSISKWRETAGDWQEQWRLGLMSGGPMHSLNSCKSKNSQATCLITIRNSFQLKSWRKVI